MTLAALLLLTLQAPPRPAFLESFDRIRVWVPQATEVRAIAADATLTVAGRKVELREVIGAAKAEIGNDPNFVVLPGNIQSKLGGKDWDPSGESTRMVKQSEGVFRLAVKLPRGSYEYKLARGGSWNENYGANFASNGANIKLELIQDTLVAFVADFNAKTLRDSINHPNDVPAPSAPLTFQPEAGDLRAGKYQSFDVVLAKPLSPEAVRETMSLRIAGQTRAVLPREVLSEPAFRYTGPLGAAWTPKQTTFRVWSPASQRVWLDLFESATSPRFRSIPMSRGPQGTWQTTAAGDLHGRYYRYRYVQNGEERPGSDIYGVGATADSSRSLVLNLAKTNPPGWPAPRLFQGKTHADAVVYEIHVRDYTVHPSSGVQAAWRGKYRGLTQAGTRRGNLPTGLDYLAHLGVTHIHLLPVHDFNPQHSQGYNWGYETTSFNVPEEQYSTSGAGEAAVREMKEMVYAMQKRGLAVVLDVVYNHSVPSEGPGSAFWQAAPYYYFRTNDRGDVLNESGVGNALHDERPMVRKFIADSLRFWAREYRIDGFRFDLMGMFATESNRVFARAIRAENPAAVIYGEPWTGGGPIRFGKGDQKGTTIALFNDRFRGALRGELDGPGGGFAMGGNPGKVALENVLTGFINDFTSSPLESMSYVSAHDNLTFRDKVALSMPNASAAERERAVRFAHAAVLLAPGLPFIEGGVELGRTKNGNNNSYNAGDELNQYRWDLAAPYAETVEYFRGLIALRKGWRALRLQSAEEVKQRVRVEHPAEGSSWPALMRKDWAIRSARSFCFCFAQGDDFHSPWRMESVRERSAGRTAIPGD